jgi:hypothetical protein
MKAHSKTHFENENIFKKKLQLAKSIKKGLRMLAGLHCDWLNVLKAGALVLLNGVGLGD